MQNRARWVMWLGLLIALPSSVLAEPRLLVSIKPLQLLVSELLPQGYSSEVLVPAAASPHHYSLRFNDQRRLKEADLVVWLGPEQEPFLRKAIAGLPPENVITLGLTSQAAQHRHAGHGHAGEEHPWLDPKRAAEMLTLLADALAQRWPAEADTIRLRQQRWGQGYIAWDKAWQTNVRPWQRQGFVVYHDAYRGLVNHFQLNQLAAVTGSDEQKPGLRHVAELRQQVAEGKVRCLFRLPGREPALVAQLAKGSELKVAVLDPMAQQVLPGQGSYFNYLEHMMATLSGCLQ